MMCYIKYMTRLTRTKAVLLILLAALFAAGGCEVFHFRGPYAPAEVSFSAEAGAYPDRIDLKLGAPAGYRIYYSTDGSLPDRNSKRYRGRIRISGNGNDWLDEDMIERIRTTGMKVTVSRKIQDAWVIRAVAVSPDGTEGPVVTKTYFPGMSLTDEYGGIMVVSLVTDPVHLFDHESGILVRGRIFDEWVEREGSREIMSDPNVWHLAETNYTQKGKAWERPVSVELFDGADTRTLQTDAGLRVHGSYSRIFPNKSMRILFRKSYGAAKLSYDLFSDGVDTYDGFVLRNGGNAADRMVPRDALIQSLLSGRSFLTQRSRPAAVYLNGEFWGLTCLNERYDEEDLQERLGVGGVLIVKEGKYEDGDESLMYLYDELLSFADRDMSDPEVWDLFSRTVDVTCMAEYFAAQVYMANYDFSQYRNDMLWRSAETDGPGACQDGKWRFMMYDTDFSCGLYDDGRATADTDTLSRVIGEYPLFASALKADAFREAFLGALREIGTTDMSYGRACEALDALEDLWTPLMERHFRRFGRGLQAWEEELRIMKAFFEARYDFMIPRAEEILGGM